MPPEDRNQLNRLEEMKSKLFSKNFQAESKRRNYFSRISKTEVGDSWKAREEVRVNIDEQLLMNTAFFKKFLIFSVVFFIFTVSYASYVFFGGGNTVSNDNIDISIIGNNFTAGGDELPIIVGITNRNNSPLDLADLIIEYPKGSTGDLSSNTERLRESLGTIPSGAVRNQNIKVVLFGEQGSTRPIKITLEYRVAGSNAIFMKDKLYEVNINSTPINLTVDSPLTISPNQDITLNITSTLNAAKPVSKILIRVSYPVGFQFVKSVPAPSFGNNVWLLGDLAPGTENQIAISGRMVGVFDGEDKTFNISSGSQSISDKSVIDVIFNSISQTVTIKKPFIEAGLFINGVSRREYATDSKTPVNVEIRYANNLDTKINDFEIVAKISGNAFDRKTINSRQGYYDSSKETITWNKNFQDNLRELNPGDSGSVSFVVSPLSLFGSLGNIISSPIIEIEVGVSGKQSSLGFAVTELKNSSSAVVRIISDVGFSTKALYYSGPFTNTGPIPPKVEKMTTYTIVWTLTNTSNSISKVKVNSVLPPWITFNNIFSPASEDLSYVASTKELVWNVDRLPKGAGIDVPSRSVSFQVSFIPSLSQLGEMPALINDAILTGHDDFANVDVKVSKPTLKTNLTGDVTMPKGGGIVVE